MKKDSRNHKSKLSTSMTHFHVISHKNKLHSYANIILKN